MFYGYEWLAVFLCSLAGCVGLVVTKNTHLSLSARGHAGETVQSAHANPTPRIGGIAIGAALVVSLYFAPKPLMGNYLLFVLSITPVFLAGLADDFGYTIRPAWRLAAAALSNIVAIVMLQLWIPRVDIPFLDELVAYAPFGIVLTVFAVSGICNAFNLIDGLNGLSTGTGAIVATGIASIAYIGGNPHIAQLSILLIAALAGFLVLNFPFGKLFLGDAGAYSLGHILGWFAILLVDRIPEVSAWAILLVFFWPVADTLFAMFRRISAGNKMGQPDRLHYHHLVMRALEILWLGRSRRHIANPLATIVLMPLIAAPALTGVLLWNQPLLGFVATLFFSFLFVASYFGLINVAKRYRSRFDHKTQQWAHVGGS